MKTLLTLLVCSVAACAAGDSLTAQTTRLTKVLWTDEKMFGLTEHYIDISAKHLKDMKCPTCWGVTWKDATGTHIEITAMEDFPAAFPVGLRKRMQDKIVMHEVLHVVLSDAGMQNGDSQDGVIFAVIPGMKGVK